MTNIQVSASFHFKILQLFSKNIKWNLSLKNVINWFSHIQGFQEFVKNCPELQDYKITRLQDFSIYGSSHFSFQNFHVRSGLEKPESLSFFDLQNIFNFWELFVFNFISLLASMPWWMEVCRLLSSTSVVTNLKQLLIHTFKTLVSSGVILYF